MKRPNIQTIYLVLCLVVIAVLSFALIYVVGAQRGAGTDVSAVEELAETIRDQYYYFSEKGLDGEKLVDGAMRGMIGTLDDPYAQYFTQEEYDNLLKSNAGDYQGIGVSVQQPDEIGSEILVVYEGGPADLAGLKAGDVITSVNGKSAASLTLQELIACFVTDGVTPNEIVYLRDGAEYTLSVTSAEVHINRVVSKVYAGMIGYIRITEFNGSVSEDFAAAAKALQDQGIKNLIIDLRDNPGGGLSEVLAVAGQLVPNGQTLVTIKSRAGSERVYKSEGTSTLDMKLVVLVNGNSASASELLTGALKDYKLATIVGTQTYGKGIVQSYFRISKNGGWAKMTTDAYFTPSDVCIQGVGITPDIVVELPDDLKGTAVDLLIPAQDTQLQAAIDLFGQQTSAPLAANG